MDDPPFLIKALVVAGLIGLAICVLILKERRKRVSPPPLPPLRQTIPPPLPETAPRVSVEELARLEQNLYAYIGDRKNDKKFMVHLDRELVRIKELGDHTTDLEFVLMGYVIGMVDLARLCSSLARAEPILLSREGDEKKAPLGVNRPDGNIYLALFTAIDKAEKAFAEFPKYTHMGKMKTTDIMEVFQIFPENTGFIINPFDEVLTITFTPEMRRAFVQAMSGKGEAASAAPSEAARPH